MERIMSEKIHITTLFSAPFVAPPALINLPIVEKPVARAAAAAAA
jgi:hypothetical protein